jgi:gliding motility-associated-like protein
VVKANANDTGLGQAVSNTAVITKDPGLSYPTAFTPNGDGLNDQFVVYGSFVNSFRMSIFNRWGEMIFSTEDINQGWDGTMNGKLVPEGTYVFRADLIDYLGRTFNESGAVLLLRKN